MSSLRRYTTPAIILLISVVVMRFGVPYASLLLSLFAGSAVADTDPTLKVTTIVGKNGVSSVECWSLPAVVSGGVKITELADLSNASYAIFPAGAAIDSGTHNAPHTQLFIILKGGAVITFPNSSDVLHVREDEIYIASDAVGTSDLGHHTVLEGGSHVLQMPLAPGFLPDHTATEGRCP